MNMIVAVDKNWGIGNEGELLVSIPADHRFFRSVTLGKVVVFGRKTMSTFPGGRALMSRTNIVLTTKADFVAPGVKAAHSLEELFELLKEYPPEDIFIIGGESVYRQLLPYCDVVHVTKIDQSFQADAFFPNLDELPEFVITKDSEEQSYFDLTYTFLQYERKKAAGGKEA